MLGTKIIDAIDGTMSSAQTIQENASAIYFILAFSMAFIADGRRATLTRGSPSARA